MRQAKTVQFQVIHWIFLKRIENCRCKCQASATVIREGTEIKDLQNFFTIPKITIAE